MASRSPAERTKLIFDALVRMTDQYAYLVNQHAVRQLKSDDSLVLPALVDVVHHCLKPDRELAAEYDVDTKENPAAELAVIALAEFDLIERVDARFARWAPEGKKFFSERMEQWRGHRGKTIADVEFEYEFNLQWNAQRQQNRRRERRNAWRSAFIAAGIIIAVISYFWFF